MEEAMGAMPFSIQKDEVKETVFESDPKKYPPKEYPDGNTPFGNLNMLENPVIEIAQKKGLLKKLDNGRALVTAKGQEFFVLYYKEFYKEGSLDGQDKVWFFGRLDHKAVESSGYVIWGLENGLLEEIEGGSN